MFQKFFELFCALEEEARANTNEDLSLIEEAERELLSAWTDYMIFTAVGPTDVEMEQFHYCLRIVGRF